MKNMKWLVLAWACGLAIPAAWGEALVSKGSSQIGIGGILDLDTEDGAVSKLSVQYSYFFWDRIALGARLKTGDDGTVNYGSLGVTGEYNFSLPANWRPLVGTDVVPFLGVALDYRYSRLYDESEHAVVYGGEGGVKFFLTDSTAIALSVVGEVASEDIYSEYPEGTNKDLYFLLSMGLYF